MVNMIQEGNYKHTRKIIPFGWLEITLVILGAVLWMVNWWWLGENSIFAGVFGVLGIAGILALVIYLVRSR
jgi:membrane-bound ClpP family serine protease